MKSSKAQIFAKFHKIPTIRFEDQELTSFSGMILFQLLFKRLGLKNRLKGCFFYLKISPIFGHHLVVMLLVTHLILGFRRLREQFPRLTLDFDGSVLSTKGHAQGTAVGWGGPQSLNNSNE